MAKVVTSDLNFNGNEIQNVVAQNLVSAPSVVKEGQFYWNTSDKKGYIFDGSEWVDLTSQGAIYSGGNGINISTDKKISINETIVALKSDIPIVNNGKLTISRNGTEIGNFYADSSTSKTIDIVVPTQASDIDALPDTTKYGSTIDVSLNETDYKLTLTLKDQTGATLSTKTVDFPIESLVVNVEYDDATKSLNIILKNGQTLNVPLSAIISGLQNEITSTNKLNSDFVDDTNSVNKFVTSGQIQLIENSLQNADDIENALGYVPANASAQLGKIVVSNPELTVVGGLCTWTITNTLGIQDVIASIRTSSGEEVIAEVIYSSSSIVVKIGSLANIPANSYKAIIVG